MSGINLRPWIATVLLLTVSSALVSCSVAPDGGNATDTEFAEHSQPLPSLEPVAIPGPGELREFSRAMGADFPTMASLRAAAELIVLVRPTGATSVVSVEQPAGSDAVYDAEVFEAEVLKARAGGKTGIKKGDRIWVVEPPYGRELLSETDAYMMLFLGEYVYWLGEPLLDREHVYVILGVHQGLWVDAKGAGKRFQKVDAESPTLPDSIGTDDALAP